MKRLKVAHVVHSFLPVTQNWIYNQLLFNTDVEHSIICQFRQNAEQFPFDNVYPVLYGPAILDKMKLQLTRLFPRFSEPAFQKIIERRLPHIIHGHFSTESWRALRVAQNRGIPLVTTFYGLDINKLPRRFVWKMRYKELFKYGSMFIVEGKFMAGKLQSLGCDPEKIRVIKIGIDLRSIGDAAVNWRPDRDGKKRVLFVGLEREKKGALDAAEAFCRAAQQYTDTELHSAGEGPYRNRVEKILRDNNCIDKAVFHGNVSVEKYRKLLVNSDIVLTPSCTASDGDTEGGAPVVCIEAQAAAKPVAGTTHCDIPNVVIDGETGLLCPEHDIDSLADNLKCLLGNEELRKKMGTRGQKNAQENHDIKTQSKMIYEVYQSIYRGRREEL